MPKFAAVAVAAALITVLAAPAAPAQSSGQAPAHRLAHTIQCFVRNPDGSTGGAVGGIATMRLDGTDRRVLTTAQDYTPAWSPDSSWIAYANLGAVAQVRAVRADGSASIELGPGAGPSWSPDGRHIAWGEHAWFHDDDSTSNQVVVQPVNVDGDGNLVVDRSQQQRIPAPHLSGRPEWSPDGLRLAFPRRQARHSEVADLHVADLRTGAVTQVTRGVNVGYGDFEQATTWSPLGDELAFFVFASRDGGIVEHAYLVRSDGTGQRRLAPTRWSDTGMSWSPAGDLLAISGRNEEGIALYRSDGTLVRTLASDRRHIMVPTWSPDGTRIYYRWEDRASGATELYSVSIDGTDTRQLTNDTTVFGSAVAASPGIVERVFGPDRIGTAVAVSRRVHDDSDVAVIARADQYADGLAGAPLAAHHEGPLLLTGSQQLDVRVGDELERLGVSTAYLLGGATALSPAVETALRARGVSNVVRLAGADRFATAARVADELGDATTAYLVEGLNADPARGWPDAVAAGAVASAADAPILLTRAGQLPAATRDAILDLAPRTVTVVGGTAAVSEAVAQQVRDAGPAVQRVAGRDRYETSARLADVAVRQGLARSAATVTSARNWPDSLASGAAAAERGTPLLLVDGASRTQPAATTQWLTSNGVRQMLAVGGNAAITPASEAGLERFGALQAPAPQPLSGACGR